MPFIEAGSCEPLRVWSRLETRSRQAEFDESLAARIHDPMFLLARQWQFGEFAGEDAGSAVFATIARRVTTVAPVDGASTDDGLEPIVERLRIAFPLIVRARLGRTVLSRIDTAASVAMPLPTPYTPGQYRQLLCDEFGILDPDPVEPVAAARDRIVPRAQRVRRALRGTSVDGVRVADALRPGMTAADLPAGFVAGLFPDHVSFVLDALEAYRAWFTATYSVPPVDSAGKSLDHWDEEQLEYRYATRADSSTGAISLVADEYVSGSLDWYSFDEDALEPGIANGTTSEVKTVIPTPAQFPGMPKPRWWQFEDAAVDLGKMRADATDIARLVVSEFALLYGNNWFVVTCRQPVGTVAEIDGIVVSDVFGFRTLVPETAGSAGSNWTAWDAFSLSPRHAAGGVAPLPQHLFLPASLPHVMEGEPHEVVALVRDEGADMVWAVERRIPDGLGGSRDGAEAARRVKQELEGSVDQPTVAGMRYLVQTDVAENWIPFIPVHVPGSTRDIRLQRGAMQRLTHPAGSRIRPVTSILRPGITDDDASATAYYVNDEEVPRAGVVVRGLMRRARRFDGVPVVWRARTVETGRGGGSSGLAFDVITGGGS
jgi:hypothetical protein